MKPEIMKEQAEAIEFLRKHYDDSTIIAMYAEDTIGYVHQTYGHDCGSVYGLDLLNFAAALINGYEIEKTPEEKVREYYAFNHDERCKVLTASPRGQYTSGVADGIRKTLDLLGVKIEGVNA
ncbi:DUF1642 domain-containing protein [Bacillus stratosphericus]|uniref:DUF1642 domain-containing protein n=1 Tax=Bacillus stratosphericus TaxID=293386 RepID=UPI001CFA3F91|nr:DUF1642 domain-containing protein [Bacillus stratosphericus]